MIREMTAGDVDVLVEMGSLMHDESLFKNTVYSPEKCRALGEVILSSDDMLGVVSLSDGQITGFFIGAIHEHYFSACLMSSDLLLYVLPDKRNGLTGVRLIKAYIEWARSRNIEDENIQLGETAGIDSAVVAKLYGKIGFIPRGTIYRLG